MTDLLGGRFGPIGWVVSFINAQHDRVLAEDLKWRQGLGQTIATSPPTPYPDSLRLLEPLESPWTTELLIECRGWTAYLNNQKNGGDPSSAAMHLANRLNTRCVTAMNSPMHGPRHGGTQLWVTGPDGEPPLMYERTIYAVAQDGRWAWGESGTPLAFENPARYTARRIRDRFDRDLLISYLTEFKIRVDDPSWFGQGITVRQIVTWPTNPETLEEAASRLALIKR